MPFINMPKKVTLSNHKIAFEASSFVSKKIEKLLSGALIEAQDQELTVCNLLGVVCNLLGVVCNLLGVVCNHSQKQ